MRYDQYIWFKSDFLVGPGVALSLFLSVSDRCHCMVRQHIIIKRLKCILGYKNKKPTIFVIVSTMRQVLFVSIQPKFVSLCNRFRLQITIKLMFFGYT